MSDLRLYELEDIAWDEFDQISDHIVPRHSNEESEPAYQEDSLRKKPNEVIGIESNAGDSFINKDVNEEQEESNQPPKRKKAKLLEDSSLHSAEGIFPGSHDICSDKVTTTVSSDCIRVPDHCPDSSYIDSMGGKFCADDLIAGEGYPMKDTNSFTYSLADVSQNESSLSFVDNERKDNESTDLLYYGWPDIENFDAVDRMFSNEDDLPWLSSSHNIEEPDGTSKSDFKVSCPELSTNKDIPERDLSKLNSACASANNSKMVSSYISYKASFQESETGDTDPSCDVTFTNEPAFPDMEGEFTLKERAPDSNGNVHFNNSTGNPINRNVQRKKQASHPKLLEGKSKDRHKSCQFLVHPENQKQKKNIAPNSFGYLQTPTPYMHLNYAHPSDQITVGSQPSGIKSEINSLPCTSRRESSYGSNQARSMESSHFHPPSAPFMSVEEKLEKLRRRQGPSSVLKQVPHSQDEAENYNGVNRANVVNPMDIYSSNVPQISTLNNISLEASTFSQLEQVMEQLDIRTKLCIRDSLYRLARSAEQRHRYSKMKDGSPSDRESGDAFVAEGSNNGFMDMETDTNPIDRSVAHLLFHRPSDPSVIPVQNGASLKSHTMIHGSIKRPPTIVGRLVCQEEAASEKKVSITDDG